MQTNDIPRIGVLSADPAAVTQFLRRVQALGADPTALLPLSPAQVEAMRRDHAVYMAGSGRINIAGLRADTIQPFVQALTACLKGDA